VNRAATEPERRRGLRDGVGDGPLPLRQDGRRGHVDRLLEERTVERVGLVEDREQMEAPWFITLRRRIRALDELLDEKVIVDLVALGADIGRRQQARSR
jgi:hypothetical protein